MNGLALFGALIAARAAVLWGHSSVMAPPVVVAYLMQDALVAIVFLGIEVLVADRRWPVRMLTVVWWLLVVYTALNVPVARALSTPLTWPMIRALGGPISDSIRIYLTGPALLTMTGVCFAGLGSRVVVRRLSLRSRRMLAAGLAALAIAAPIAGRNADTRGLHRNAVLVLVRGLLPTVQASGRDRDWREPPFGGSPASDLSDLRSVGAGRNVVVIGLESTAAQYLRLFGAREDVLPNVEALAGSSIVFDRAYTVSPDSIRSLFSLLCSRYPAFDTRPEAFATTPCASLAGTFREAGYQTALFHSGRFGYLGIDAVIERRGFQVLEDAGTIGGDHQSSFGAEEPAAVDRILHWIDGLAPGQRFFLTYLPIAGHHPYDTPTRAAFGSATALDRYRSALRYGDDALGVLFDGLQRRGLFEQTLFVLYGDHGQAFGQHEGNVAHTFFLYEENVHVPLLFALPGAIDAPLRSDAVASLVDIAPTLVDLAGLAPDDRRQGRSLLGGAPQLALFFTDYGSNLAGLRDGRWKFIHDLGSSQSQLFDLAVDPAERRDQHHVERARTDAYVHILEGWSAAEKDRLRPGSP